MNIKPYILALLLTFTSFAASAQEDLNFSAWLQPMTPEQRAKVATAIAVAEAVAKASHYIKSLDDLFTEGIVPLPVGVKSDHDGYELIIHKIRYENNDRQLIYATCAFSFKDAGNDTSQRIAFEGWAEISGKKGFGNSGKLSLIAPVARKIGNHSVIVVRAGTQVSFGCNGIEGFDAKLGWLVTSDKIYPVDADGKKQEGGQLGVAFDASFDDFDSYIISINVKNTVNITRLESLLNSNSLNQAFVKFSVSRNVWRMKNISTSTYSTHISAYRDISNALCRKYGTSITFSHRPRTVYVVLTDLEFGASLDAGGVGSDNSGNKNNLAMMWLVDYSGEDKHKAIIHEIGHSLGLEDVFKDEYLGGDPNANEAPAYSLTRSNYMDYFIPRKMFFKTQLEEIINNLD
jgi:hypothetical protein